jgi:hypothetical protein
MLVMMASSGDAANLTNLAERSRWAKVAPRGRQLVQYTGPLLLVFMRIWAMTTLHFRHRIDTPAKRRLRFARNSATCR